MLAAAGSGSRLGLDRPKAFAPLGGRPLLAESLARLDASEWIDAIVVAAPPGWEESAILLTEELAASKVRAVVAGGATRAHSVSVALGEVSEDALVVVVHDAARPLIDEDVIERVLLPLGEGYDGAIPVVAVPDTMKRVEGGLVLGTVDRTGIVAAQTPQAFLASTLRSACAAGSEDASDCASLVERHGGRIRAVDGDVRLLKITTPADLALVESWL